jgi:hypothetical protein
MELGREDMAKKAGKRSGNLMVCRERRVVEDDVWVDRRRFTSINLFTYPSIYGNLTPARRRSLLVPLLPQDNDERCARQCCTFSSHKLTTLTDYTRSTLP